MKIYSIDGWDIVKAEKWTVHPTAPEILELKQPSEITRYKLKPEWSNDRAELVKLLKERRAETISMLKEELAMLKQLDIK